ncbi:MAG: hypothetical protein FWC39_07930 [Bacteroidetes bacterium]|nr:hypothetical protein [Bacteroidota bacterium]
MKTLHLTLSKKPFEVMITGEKKVEFRKTSEWIKNRLLDKNGNQKAYDVIKFTNGYGNDKPYFVAEYNSFIINIRTKTIEYSNGLNITAEYGDIEIYLGDIIEKGNI